jgi:hypothetical protein
MANKPIADEHQRKRMGLVSQWLRRCVKSIECLMMLPVGLIRCLESAVDIHTTFSEGVGHYAALTSRQIIFICIFSLNSESNATTITEGTRQVERISCGWYANN